MFVPGNNPGMMQDAFIYGPDSIMLDLEDSVTMAEKDAARLLVFNALKSIDYGDTEMVVRINPLSTPYGHKDVEAVVKAGVQVIRMPKTETADEVRELEAEIEKVEKELGCLGRTRMMAAIESAEGICNAFAIAKASKRMMGIALGAEDYCANLKTQRTPGGAELLYARETIVVAARAAGIDALDTVYSNLDDMETFRKDLQKVQSKVVTLEDAIRLSGLKDGMTISFHHHFRGGDKVVNMVVGKLAEMGFKNLHLAASSLSDVHAPLIDHIKNGVITKISTSGLRGELAKEISHGLMKEPVVFRSHGGRGSAIANGDLHIDVAFLGASSSDPAGNASGYSRSEHAKSICGSLGYAKPDAQYADKVVIITDDLVDYPNTPNSISEHDVDYVVLVDSVGDSSKISSGAIRDTKNPRDILLAMNAAKVIVNSGYFKEGFSIQTGSGGASLAAVKYIREEMIKRGIHSSFALGGITAHMVKMHEEGLIGRLIDVQSFDRVAAESIKNDPFHKGVSANEYASADEPGSAVHYLDIVILSALEVDVNFNVNVLVGSDGVIRGAVGGHPDTAADSALSIIVCPLMRGRIPCVVDEVTTLITPGSTVDVVVTEYGIAVNPRRPEIAERLREAGLKIVDIHDLKELALKSIGVPDPLPFGEKVVGVVMNRDGSVMDVIMNIED